ncbi:hypothetical protein J5N97_018474 [Dioscorea zingiberensis]|uniref:Tryptophanyl-tRNA synthetase n=1 Tax=Dioscorea zingiberensis TaxID=325984 RepID=A0A9D5CPC7_9LILI|nr:hypothetical protein J5N97_018474 [Dioscorea zingiberensis]
MHQLLNQGPLHHWRKHFCIRFGCSTMLFHLEIVLGHFKGWKVLEDPTHVYEYMKLLFNRESFMKTKPTKEHVIVDLPRRANFTSADMRESDFSGCSFNGVYLEKAVAYKANFSGVDLGDTLMDCMLNYLNMWAEWNGKYRDDIRRFIKVYLKSLLEDDRIHSKSAFYENVVKVANCVIFNKVVGIFGFTSEDHIGKIRFPPVQSFPRSFPHIFSNKNNKVNNNLCSLILCAIDQGENGKMSVCDPNSAIYLTDSLKDIKSKVDGYNTN